MSAGGWSDVVDEEEKIIRLINRIHEHFPDLHIIFDGWSQLVNGLSARDRKIISEINDRIVRIRARIPDGVEVTNINGSSVFEKINAYNSIDCYFARFGSPLTLPSWICDKPGVAYASPEMLSYPWQPLYSEGFFEHMTKTVLTLPKDLSHNVEGGYDFDMDWCIDRVLETLRQSDHNNSSPNEA